MSETILVFGAWLVSFNIHFPGNIKSITGKQVKNYITAFIADYNDQCTFYKVKISCIYEDKTMANIIAKITWRVKQPSAYPRHHV